MCLKRHLGQLAGSIERPSVWCPGQSHSSPVTRAQHRNGRRLHRGSFYPQPHSHPIPILILARARAHVAHLLIQSLTYSSTPLPLGSASRAGSLPKHPLSFPLGLVSSPHVVRRAPVPDPQIDRMRIPFLAATGLSLSLPRLGAPSISDSDCDSACVTPKREDISTIWATPHDSYSSSIGVPGCKINTNRVAYWPQSVDCDNICVSLEYEDRQVYLLRIDQSTGAHDVSYDAWNYLYTGKSATEKPTSGGPVAMQYRNVDASKCKSLIHTKDNKLPLSAANSMNFLAGCLAQSDSWVANNYMALNIVDSICTLGVDELCKLNWPDANQPSCPHVLGGQVSLKDAPVYNIQYPSGKKVLASSGLPSAGGGGGSSSDEDNAAGRSRRSWALLVWCFVFFFSFSSSHF
ncbi:hypothetical protein J3459_017902 [Metarhizium acridum]|uniref:uncharacterized protein n=1 Tax=Metarhizium acridum TaxID=92637 RepID=UPI001C6C1E6C|nr:hypothetical protein J3459_017902 [Metarhizium acridum]KAG8411701.1 hypothetical protein J3458_015288 [Metarhizium acridum]